MTERNDGGPAFPVMTESSQESDFDTKHYWRGGLSLRDYFAAAALTGLCSRSSNDATFRYTENRAHVAYQYADAMLAERERADQ